MSWDSMAWVVASQAVMAFLPSPPHQSAATYVEAVASPQFPPSAARWFLSDPGGPWAADVVGDGVDSES